MRSNIKRAIGNTVQDLINNGIKTSFSVKELKELGVKIPDVEINATDVKKIREKISVRPSLFTYC